MIFHKVNAAGAIIGIAIGYFTNGFLSTLADGISGIVAVFIVYILGHHLME